MKKINLKNILKKTFKTKSKKTKTIKVKKKTSKKINKKLNIKKSKNKKVVKIKKIVSIKKDNSNCSLILSCKMKFLQDEIGSSTRCMLLIYLRIYVRQLFVRFSRSIYMRTPRGM